MVDGEKLLIGWDEQARVVKICILQGPACEWNSATFLILTVKGARCGIRPVDGPLGTLFGIFSLRCSTATLDGNRIIIRTVNLAGTMVAYTPPQGLVRTMPSSVFPTFQPRSTMHLVEEDIPNDIIFRSRNFIQLVSNISQFLFMKGFQGKLEQIIFFLCCAENMGTKLIHPSCNTSPYLLHHICTINCKPSSVNSICR